RMLADASATVLDTTYPIALDDDSLNQNFDLDMLLEGLEPFPFMEVSCEELFKQDGRCQQDVQEFAPVCPTTMAPRVPHSYYFDDATVTMTMAL
ncbi:Myb-like dna-binding protein, partial [Globisporangium polare]